MNLENEAEKASVGAILDVVRNDLEDPAQDISGNVPLIEEVIATNKDTPVVGTTQDVAQHANAQAQEIDAEQIINAQVKNRGMATNNGDEGERAEATDLSRGMHTNNSEGERAEATDLSMTSVDLVEVPNQSSIDEDQQHITAQDGEEYLPDLPDSTLRTFQKNYEPSTSVEGTNHENEAEKASLGEQRNTILDVVRKEPAQETSEKVTLIEEVIATNKDTPAVGTTQDVAQDANTPQEIDAEEIINALVKNRGMHTNNGEDGEQVDEDITGGGEQAEVTDLSLERTCENKKIVADEDITSLADPIEQHAEPSSTGLHAEQSKDKKTSANVASPTKQGSVEGTVQNNDDGRKWGEGTSLLSLLSMESPGQTQTRRRSESMTLDNMSESRAQDFRRRERKAVTSRSGPLAQPSRLPPMGAGNPNTLRADLEAVRPDPDPSLGFHFVKKTFGLLRKQQR